MLKSHSVMQQLIQKCFSGEYVEGMLLPGECELCTEFEVSRSSIRAALQAMVNKGIISTFPKKGSLVNHISKWNWLDSQVLEIFNQEDIHPDFIKNLLLTRLTFEPNICAISATVSDTSDLIDMFEGYELMMEGAAQNERSLFLEGDKLFHSAIVRSCKNPFLSSLDGVLSTAMTISFNKTLETDLYNALPALNAHKALLEAIRTRDAKKAKSISKEIILTAIKKIVVDEDNLLDDFIQNII